MTGNQIPEETASKWDKMSLVESSKATLLQIPKAYFSTWKYDEEIVEAARGDQQLAEEVQQLKASIKSNDEEKKKH